MIVPKSKVFGSASGWLTRGIHFSRKLPYLGNYHNGTVIFLHFDTGIISVNYAFPVKAAVLASLLHSYPSLTPDHPP